jgi:hypothetical protein
MPSLNWTRFETQRRASRLLDALLAELDENKIAAEIDAPIDEALADPDLFPGHITTYTDFLRATAAFVERVNRAACRDRASLAAPITLDETVASLGGYQGPTAWGHDAAVVDARRDDGAWVGLVLLRLGEVMKAARRDARWRRLEAQCTQGIDWKTRCEMVRILMERARRSLPHELTSCPPEQLAGHLFELVRTVAQ